MKNSTQFVAGSVDAITLVPYGFGQPYTFRLTATFDFSIPADLPLGSLSLCQACVSRLPVGTVGRLLVSLILGDEIAGKRPAYTYAGLGTILGREASTVERAAVGLRRMGLLVSQRLRQRGHEILFSCRPFLDWADATIRQCTPAASSPSQAQPVLPSVPRQAPDALEPDPAQQADARGLDETDVELVYGKPETFAADDHPDWPAVDPNWRVIHRIALPTGPYTLDYAVPAGTKPWLGPVPRLPNGLFDTEKLMMKPRQLQSEDELDAWCAVIHELEAQRYSGRAEAAVDDPPVDATEEREAEARLDGQRADDGEDSFSFASGADTSETDMGHGVRVNPDL